MISRVSLWHGQLQNVTLRQNYRSFNHILKLTNVSGPFVIDDGVHHFIRNGFYRSADTLGALLYEVAHKERYVRAPLSQGWQHERKYMGAVVQVAPKASCVHHSFEIAIAGSDKPDLHSRGAISSKSFKLLFLDCTQ
jgi:hypothetical protein